MRSLCIYLHINKEIKQIDYLIDIEDQRINELKEALQKKKELNSNEFKQKLEEIDELEFKKNELKGENNRILDSIENLEEQKETLQNTLQELKAKIINNVKIKKKLKDKEINERKKQSEIKDQLYEKKRHMDSLQDDVTTKAKEVQELKRLLSKLNSETQDFEDSKAFNDNLSLEKEDIDNEIQEGIDRTQNKIIEKQIFNFFSDAESNPRNHSVIKVSDREYQVGTHSMFPILQNEIVMLNTPSGVLSLFEFYNNFLNKEMSSSTNKLISSQERNNQHFIFSGKQFDIDYDNEDNSRSINSQFEVNEEGIDDQDRIEFQIDDYKKDPKGSFLESIDSDDSYLISKIKHEKSPDNSNFIADSGEKKYV